MYTITGVRVCTYDQGRSMHINIVCITLHSIHILDTYHYDLYTHFIFEISVFVVESSAALAVPVLPFNYTG